MKTIKKQKTPTRLIANIPSYVDASSDKQFFNITVDILLQIVCNCEFDFYDDVFSFYLKEFYSSMKLLQGFFMNIASVKNLMCEKVSKKNSFFLYK